MPRSIESILRNHKNAVELRSQGRPIWNTSIRIKRFLSESLETPAQYIDAGKKIAKAIRNNHWIRRNYIEGEMDVHFELEDILSLLEDPLDSADDPERRSDEEAFNSVLDQLYDWADQARVWVD